MDVIQDWATLLLQHVGSSSLQPLLPLYDTLRVHVVPFAQTLVAKLAEKPDLATLALLAIILWLSLKILGFFYGLVMYWVRMAVRLALLAALLAAGTYVATRGVEGAADDARYWAGVWTKEYRRYQDQVDQAREWQLQQMQQQQPMARR